MAAPTIVRSDKSFDMTIDGRRAGFLSYVIEDDSMLIEYVEVDPSQRGRGLGEKLIDAAVAWAKDEGHKVVPICGFARAVLRRRQK